MEPRAHGRSVTFTLRIAMVVLSLLFATACANRGREVFAREGCADCHKFRGTGGGLGPDLSGIASRMDGRAMRMQIVKPEANNPAARMPAFKHLGWFDLHALEAFLRS